MSCVVNEIIIPNEKDKKEKVSQKLVLHKKSEVKHVTKTDVFAKKLRITILSFELNLYLYLFLFNYKIILEFCTSFQFNTFQVSLTVFLFLFFCVTTWFNNEFVYFCAFFILLIYFLPEYFLLSSVSKIELERLED